MPQPYHLKKIYNFCVYSYLSKLYIVYSLRIIRIYFKRDKERIVLIWNLVIINHRIAKTFKYSDCPVSISWFQAAVLNFYQGTEPILTLRSCISEAGQASMPMYGQSEKYLPHRLDTWYKESQWAAKDFCWKCSIQADTFLLDCSFKAVKVEWLLKGKNHEKSQLRKTGKWRETNWVQGPYSESLPQVLLIMPIYMSWLTPLYNNS